MDKPKVKKAGRLSSTKIAAALSDDSTSSSSSAKPQPKPATSSSHTPGPASADLFDDTMPPLSESMMGEFDKAADKDLDERIFSEDIEKDLDPDYVVPDLEEASDEEEDEVYGAASKPPQTPVRVKPGTPGTFTG